MTEAAVETVPVEPEAQSEYDYIYDENDEKFYVAPAAEDTVSPHPFYSIISEEYNQKNQQNIRRAVGYLVSHQTYDTMLPQRDSARYTDAPSPIILLSRNTVYDGEPQLLIKDLLASGAMPNRLAHAIMYTAYSRHGSAFGVTGSIRRTCEALLKHKRYLQIVSDELRRVRLEWQGAGRGVYVAFMDNARYQHTTVDFSTSGEPYLTVDFKTFDLPVKTKFGGRLIGGAVYHATIKLGADGSWRWEKMRAEATGHHRPNPHINGGLGGGVCLGGYAMEFSRVAEAKSTIQFGQLVDKFNADHDPSDEWGRRIAGCTQIWFVETAEGELVAGYGTDYSLDANALLKDGYYARGCYLVPHSEWVKCYITGKIIRRDSATRLPVYISDEALTTVHNYTVGSQLNALFRNKWDWQRLRKSIDAAWKNKHKRNMPKMIDQARKDERVAEMQLKELSNMMLNGHVEQGEVSRVVNVGWTNARQSFRNRTSNS